MAARPARLRVFTAIDVYESATSYVLVGHADARRHLLHVSRVAGAAGAASALEPPVVEDPRAYTEAACEAQLLALGASGGALTRVLRASALLGMVRFLEGWSMLFVTRTEVAGVIGGHAIHRIEETVFLSVAPPAGASSSGSPTPSRATDSDASQRTSPAALRAGASGGAAGGSSAAARGGSKFVAGGRKLLQAAAAGLGLSGWTDNWAESRYRALFSSMDLTRDFYFSYTYDLSNTLQTNLGRGAEAAGPTHRHHLGHHLH
jgi:hypothetical protein